MTRDELYGRMIALLDLIGDRVLDKGAPPISTQFLGQMRHNPSVAITLAHKKIMQHARKFGEKENLLLDMFGQLIVQLDVEEFTERKPLEGHYTISFYHQRSEVPKLVGVAEAAKILGWSKQQISVYMSREKFPEPAQRLASGPIWTRDQIEEFKNSRTQE